jgi:hypothetical protein
VKEKMKWVCEGEIEKEKKGRVKQMEVMKLWIWSECVLLHVIYVYGEEEKEDN